MNNIAKVVTSGFLVTASLLYYTAIASADNGRGNLKNISYTNQQIYDQAIHVISSDRKKWDQIKSTPMLFGMHINVEMKRRSRVSGAAIVIGACEGNSCRGKGLIWQEAAPADTKIFARQQSVSLTRELLPISGQNIAVTPYGSEIVDRCNNHLQADGPTKQYSFDHIIHTTLVADSISPVLSSNDTTGLGGGANHDPEQLGSHYQVDHSLTKPMKIKVVCDPIQKGAANDLVAEAPDFKLKDLKLFLTTYTGNESQPDQFHKCKRARILMRAITSTAGPVKLRLWTKFGDDQLNSELVEAWSSFDGNTGYKAEVEKWITVEKTSHLYAIVEDANRQAYGESKGVTIPCETIGSGDDFATVPTDADEPPVQAAKVTGVIALNPKTEYSNGMHFGKVAIRLESNKSGDTNYKLTCADGREWSGSLPTQKANSGKYVASKIHGFRFNKTTDMGCALKSTTMNGDPVIAIATHTYEVPTTTRNTTDVGKVIPTVKPRPKKPNKIVRKPAQKEPVKAAKQAVKLLNKVINAQRANRGNQRQTAKKKIKIFALPGAKKR